MNANGPLRTNQKAVGWADEREFRLMN